MSLLSGGNHLSGWLAANQSLVTIAKHFGNGQWSFDAGQVERTVQSEVWALTHRQVAHLFRDIWAVGFNHNEHSRGHVAGAVIDHTGLL